MKALLFISVLAGSAVAFASGGGKLPISTTSMFVAEGALNACVEMGYLKRDYVDGVIADFRDEGKRYTDMNRNEADVHRRVGKAKILEEGKGREEAACKIFNHVLIEGIVRATRPLGDMGIMEIINKDPLRQDEVRLYTVHFCAGYYDVLGFGADVNGPAMQRQQKGLIARMLKERDLLAKKALSGDVSESERALFNKGRSQAQEDLGQNRIGLSAKRVKACATHIY